MCIAGMQSRLDAQLVSVSTVISNCQPVTPRYRLAVFRDDVVFLIYLYQRWIYRVDKNRVNEFGFTGDEDQKPEEDTIQDGMPSPAIADTAAGTSTATDTGKAATQRRQTVQEVRIRSCSYMVLSHCESLTMAASLH